MRKLRALTAAMLLSLAASQAFGQGETGEILSILRSKTVFVTSQTFNENLGGLEGADEKCQEAADDAGLDGTFMAWLSTIPSESPGTRFMTHSVRPYIDTVGSTITADWGDLRDGTINTVIDRDENTAIHA